MKYYKKLTKKEKQDQYNNYKKAESYSQVQNSTMSFLNCKIYNIHYYTIEDEITAVAYHPTSQPVVLR